MKKYFKKFSTMFVMALVIMLGSCVSAFAEDITYTDNLIPKMTSNTSPSGIADSSSSYGTSYLAYKAFDKAYYPTSSSYYWMASSGSVPQWISYKFENPKKICKYTISYFDYGDYSRVPKSWQFQGSNDDLNWVTLDSQYGINFAAGEKKKFTFNNTTNYSNYRIYITAINGGGSYGATIDEIEMMEKIQNNATSITLDKSTMNLEIGTSQQLTATTTAADATVNWTSSDSSIATVDSNGKVTAVKEGQVTITVTTADGSNLSATCAVNVTTTTTGGGDPTNPPDTGSGSDNGDATLFIELVDGNIKQYSLTDDQISDFIQWYRDRDNDDSESPIYKFTKGSYKDYVVHDKIDWFEIR